MTMPTADPDIDEGDIEIKIAGEGEPVVDAAEVKAAQAEASAEAASTAAAEAIALADVSAAHVAVGAAAEISAYQERLASCEATLENVIRSQAESEAHRTATESRLTEAMDTLRSIQQRLEPRPESPTNPPPDDAAPVVEVAVPEPAAEPERPRRHPHRWI
jgi:hypothetical protein